MSDYVFLVGDDYDSSNKEYVSINSDKGKLISIALAASGIPFKGRFDKERMLFNYDGIYKESVDEIIAKFTSDKYAKQRDEIAEHEKSLRVGVFCCGKLIIPYLGWFFSFFIGSYHFSTYRLTRIFLILLLTFLKI